MLIKTESAEIVEVLSPNFDRQWEELNADESPASEFDTLEEKEDAKSVDTTHDEVGGKDGVQ